MGPERKAVSARRLRWGTLALGVTLLALWLLEQGADPETHVRRQRLAAGSLARDGLRRLAAPLSDARGRASRRMAIRVDAQGAEICLEELDRALRAHPAFRRVAVADGRAVPLLKARCTIRRAPQRSTGIAEVTLSLRVEDPGAGWKPPPVRLSQRIAGSLALIPPLVAVVLALATGHIYLAMLLAVLCGALVFVSSSPVRLDDPFWHLLLRLPLDLVLAFWRALVHDILGSTLGQFKLQVMFFATALVGMVAVITRAGGTHGLLLVVSRLSRSPPLARLSVWLMGLVLFFDDCANTLVVGSTARPITDAARVSREKLAYLVDSTAAPVAGVAVISTWIGFEIGLLQTAADSLGLDQSGFEIFWGAMPLRFYCLLTLLFVLLATLLRRDFGPMLHAERRAARGEVLAAGGDAPPPLGAEPPADLPPRWIVAALPILTVLVGVLGGIVLLGHQTGGVRLALDRGLYPAGSIDHLRDCFAQAAREGLQGWALLGAGVAGSLVALALALGQRRHLPRRGPELSARDLGRVYLSGGRTIGGAIAVLVCAWAIQTACDDLGTSITLTAALADTMEPTLLPILIFLTAAAVSFATGTSWGTMGILIPTVLPLANALAPGDTVVLYLAAGAILDGAIFGDHCSPISDTTVMSSLSSGCPHLEHIRTQLPYALTVMVAAGGCGYVGRSLGLPTWACYLLAAALLGTTLLLVGRNPDRTPPPRSQPSV